MRLGIYGSSGAGRTVKEMVDLIGKWDEIIFIDDTVEPDVFKGIPRMPYDIFKQKYDIDDTEVVIALGEPKYKELLFGKVAADGYHFTNVFHPTSIISPSAKLGQGIIVHAGSIISADATVEDNVTLQQYVVVAHDAIIHSHVQISAFTVIAGRCEVGESTYIGLHAAVKDKVKIGSQSLVGMGSIVVKDVPDLVTVAGNPARAIMKRTTVDKVFE